MGDRSSSSLDGFLAREDGSFDCFPNDPQAEHVTDYLATLQSPYDTVLMGRSTYEAGFKYGCPSRWTSKVYRNGVVLLRYTVKR